MWRPKLPVPLTLKSCTRKMTWVLVALIGVVTLNILSLSHEAIKIAKDAIPELVDWEAAMPKQKHQGVVRPIVDIISIGSLQRPDLQDAQQRTFGSARNIRNFHRFNELNDTETTCHTNLTNEQMDTIKSFCAVMEHRSYFGKKQDMLVLEKHIPGWICAQKRPIDGLYHTLRSYNHMLPIPDYLFIIDDDTYLNVDRLIPDLQAVQNYTAIPNQPVVHTGCMYRFFKGDVMYPHGGYGTYLNKGAIERFLRPIYCQNSTHNNSRYNDQQNYLNCWRIEQNFISEKQFFSNGMSVNDLMYAFTSKYMFTQVNQWTDVGYCFHSDHALGYFITFYNILVPDAMVSFHGPDDIFDDIRRKYAFSDFPGRTDCNRGPDERFENEFRIYHYMNSTHMDEAWEYKKRNFTEIPV